jgi:hypothetical protein
MEFPGPIGAAASSHRTAQSLAAHDPAAKLSTRYDIVALLVPLLRWTGKKLKAAFPKSLFDRI